MVPGGISSNKKHAVFNKQTKHYMSNNYHTKPPVYIVYHDTHNVYDWAMSQPLP
ncbi:hypothetical protein CHS0354_029725, partial [Potamilus streckersoni]